MSGGRQPAYSLLAQAGARIEYDERRGIFVPVELPPNIAAVGSVVGGGGSSTIPRPAYAGRGKCFVCHCEDVTVKDVKRALAEGFDSIELAKRYTTVTMGPCQGKLCQLNSIRLIAYENGEGEAAIGATTARPPWAPIEMGMLAGRDHEPCRRTSAHHRHEEAGATMMWTGSWKRPHSYGDVAGEVRAVHEDLGLIDVSTLGKILVEGPDAGAFLDRLYPNRFSDLKPGRIRYSVLTTDGGRIMDDGDDRAASTTSSSTSRRPSPAPGACSHGSSGGTPSGAWTSRSSTSRGALAAVNLAGPRAREALGALTDMDVSNEGISYLDAKAGRRRRRAVPRPAHRLRRRARLRAPLPEPVGEHLWDTLVARRAGAKPFGLEPQRILRLEKGHILVGQDTDSESNLLSAGHGLARRSSTRTTSSGKWATELVAERGVRERLVGFVMRNPVLPLEGGQIVQRGPLDRPRHELALQRGGRAARRHVLGAARACRGRGRVPDHGRRDARAGARAPAAVLRPRGGEAEVVSTLAFMSPELAAPEALASPLARALAAADPALGLQDLSRLGKVELRGDVAAFAPEPAEELLRLTPQRAFVLGRRRGRRDR